MHAYVCAYMCECVHAHECMSLCMHAHMSESASYMHVEKRYQVLSLIPLHLASYNRVSHQPELNYWLDWLDKKPQGCFCFCLITARIAKTGYHASFFFLHLMRIELRFS